MKLDPKGIETALKAFLDCGSYHGSDDDKRDMENGIRAYLKATNSVIVPVEPTVGMLEAGENAFFSTYTGTLTATPWDVYRSMLQASQESE